jgi:hypothetical protein
MLRPRALFALFALGAPLVFGAAGCSHFTPIYPPRPPSSPGAPIADPPPSRVVVHATVSGSAIRDALEQTIPRAGEGTFPLLGAERRFVWRRWPLEVRFDRGRISVGTHAAANADLPIGSLDIPLDLEILAEPVVTSEYIAKLQSLEVRVTTKDSVTKLADAGADVLEKVRADVQTKLEGFSQDLRPALAEAYGRLALPVDLPLGEAHGCASLRLVGVEAGPTVLADGVEKDLALVVAPSVTIPCSPEPLALAPPPLANVASMPSGPFTVRLPIAARYDELAKAMTMTFTNGKLFFSKDYPELYMEKPEVYAGNDQLVLKLHIRGPIHALGIDTVLDGDLFMTGHPVVQDNELSVPDLEPTIETSSFLLKLKDILDGGSIRDQARAALRLDLSERIQGARAKLSTDLGFGDGAGCMRAAVDKVDVVGLHPHGQYLRVQLDVTAHAGLYVPCPADAAPAPAPPDAAPPESPAPSPEPAARAE